MFSLHANPAENYFQFRRRAQPKFVLETMRAKAGVRGRIAPLVTALSVPFSDQVILPAA
jgi:hypothetical protein